MRRSPSAVHPIVKVAAALVVLGAAAAGVWVGSFGAASTQQAAEPAPAPDPTFIEAGDTLSPANEAQHGAAVFEQRCASCHTIGGGDRRGPDLAQTALRRDPEGVEAMIAAPDSMFRADSVAQWILRVHDIAPESATADNPDLQALSAYFASFGPAR